MKEYFQRYQLLSRCRQWFALAGLVLIASFVQARELYPTNWWVGMKDPNLQLMIREKGIADRMPMLKISEKGIKLADGVTLKKIIRVENPNYIFLDLVIDKNAKPGKREFVFGSGDQAVRISYELMARNAANGKSRVQGVSSKDFIYLMMPDRFSNGDPSNDIIPGYRDQTSERKNKWSRHGGDFKGIQNHFDYFNELGVTAIWMTPVLENNTNLMHEWGNDIAGYHGYWFTDHYEIDKRFGGNEGYRQLIDAAHQKGIKIIQDAVYNHISKEHWIALDPPEKDWIHQWPSLTTPNHREETIFDPYGSAYDKKNMLDGWFTDHLPDLNQTNPQLAKFLIQHAVWTTEYFGIDGWRVDTYKYCDEQFLNDVNAALEREFPGITIFGEAWVNTIIGNAYFTQNRMQPAFEHNANSVIDFQVAFGMHAGMQRSQEWTDGVNKLYMTMAQDFVYSHPDRNCIFLDNHDMDRVFSTVGEDWNKLKMGLTWLLTLRGIPQLYYGTEILMKNFKNPTDALVREDFPGGWADDPKNKFTEAARTTLENQAFTHVSRLANFRKGSTALTTGKTMQFVPREGFYVYFRYNDQETVMVMANTGKKAVKPSWNVYAERVNGFKTARDIITGTEVPLENLELAPGESAVYLLKK
jgi:glycosidase